MQPKSTSYYFVRVNVATFDLELPLGYLGTLNCQIRTRLSGFSCFSLICTFYSILSLASLIPL